MRDASGEEFVNETELSFQPSRFYTDAEQAVDGGRLNVCQK